MSHAKGNMKNKFLYILCGFLTPLVCSASNEGVPSYYNGKNTKTTANAAAYGKYQKQGYTKYVGSNGNKQVLSSNTYSYKVPSQRTIYDYQSATMTTNGIAQPAEDKSTSIYAGYTRRFANFNFKTGVNSVLEWNDMIFNEVDLGAKHIFDIYGFDLGVYGEYTYGKMSSGGLSMDYDLEPYDYSFPNEGVFTVSVGGESGDLNKLKLGISAHHVWDLGGWKITPHFGYEIFKHNLEMNNHLYPNPGVYIPLMTSTGFYVYGNTAGEYFTVPTDAVVDDKAGLYQICMDPTEIKVVLASTSSGTITPIGTALDVVDYSTSMGNLPWGVAADECVVIGGDGAIRVAGTTHIYKTTWSGFYLGLEFEKQMTLADKLRFYFQVSMPKYSSEGTWPNRDDWQQNPSFLDEGDNGAFAYEAEMEYSYSLSDRLQLSLTANTDYFHIGQIPGELYVAPITIYTEDPNNPGSFIVETQPAYTEYVSESLKYATWQSFSFRIGLKYSF